MVHPQLSTWYELEMIMGDVPLHEVEKMTPEDVIAKGYEVSIGRFKSDGQYHVVGYRPILGRAYFSSNECASFDLGFAVLPRGKSSIDQLVKGDVVTVKTEPNDWHVTYLRHA